VSGPLRCLISWSSGCAQLVHMTISFLSSMRAIEEHATFLHLASLVLQALMPVRGEATQEWKHSRRCAKKKSMAFQEAEALYHQRHSAFHHRPLHLALPCTSIDAQYHNTAQGSSDCPQQNHMLLINAAVPWLEPLNTHPYNPQADMILHDTHQSYRS
jgi:hypothetical protein